jgi:NAD(P)-dependent dehydrogenase (short-subunit alcohol dehydrogenase family)
VAKRVLVTGGAKRIGRAIAERLSAAGYDVVIHFRESRAEAETLAQALAAGGAKTAAIKADLANPDEVNTLVARAAAALGGPLSALVNSAGAFVRDDLASATAETRDANFQPNLFAPLTLSLAFFRTLPEKGHGAVINLIDQRVQGRFRDSVSYTLSKQSLLALTETLAQAMAPRVHVVGIGPGPTLPSVYQSEEDFNNERAAVPLGVAPSADDIAAAVQMALENPGLSGQMIAVDGGQHFAKGASAHAKG